MQRSQRELISAKADEIRNWLKKDLGLGKGYDIKVTIKVTKKKKPPRHQIDESYVLTQADWQDVYKAVLAAPPILQEHFHDLIRQKFIQFHDATGSRLRAANRYLKARVPFILRAPDQRGHGFHNQQYRLFRIVGER